VRAVQLSPNYVAISISFFLSLWRCDPTRVMASSFLKFLDHTQRPPQSVGLLWTSDQLVQRPLPDNTQHTHVHVHTHTLTHTRTHTRHTHTQHTHTTHTHTPHTHTHKRTHTHTHTHTTHTHTPHTHTHTPTHTHTHTHYKAI
jgi:hypothetical protein